MTTKQESFEKVGKFLYKRRYQTADGHSRMMFYAIFTDWKRKRRKFPLGGNLEDAQDALGELKIRNKGRYDFDAEKKKLAEDQRRAVTFSAWGNRYFNDQLSPKELRANSADREKRAFGTLQPFFGDLPLADIKIATVLEYRKRRKADGVGFVTVNRELSFLRKLLNVATDQDPPLIESVPRFKLPNEASRVRIETVSPEDYAALLSHMKRPAQRYLIALYETAMRLSEPLKLTWDKVDLRAGLIRLNAEDVKENYARRTPISWELRQVFDELRDEQRKIPNLGRCVFTRTDGQPITSIRTAFEMARHKAGLDTVRPHDFRRAAISRWTDWRVPRDFVMAAAGHKPANVHDRYLVFTDRQITDAFKVIMVSPEERQKVFPWCSHSNG